MRLIDANDDCTVPAEPGRKKRPMDDARDRLRIVLHPSRLLPLTLFGAYAGAGVCLLAIDTGASIKTFLFAFLLLSAYCDLGRHAAARGRCRIAEMIFDAGADWLAFRADGQTIRGRPGASCLVHPLAVCFTLEQSGKSSQPVLILSDMCNADDFRRLRLWLRAHNSDGRGPASGSRFASRLRLGDDSRA